jgi:RNA polymerase sigma-70 factor, ECF subfamily
LSTTERLPDIDRQGAVAHLLKTVHTLKPLERQITLSYLEDMGAAQIAEITGLSVANIGMKNHRIKNILARSFLGEKKHAG